MKDCLDCFIKVKKEDVCLYAPFFEAFEGMLSLRTPDPAKDEWAIMHFMVSPDFKKEFENVVAELALPVMKGKASFATTAI